MILYGSRAKGSHKLNSDIDLAVAGERLTGAVLSRIEGDLEDHLLPYKIDLSLMANIDNQNLLEHIQRVGRKF